MKTLMAVLIAVLSLVDISQADRILIYKGSITEKTVGTLASSHYTASKVTTAYYFFDVDNSEYNYITYSDIKGVKTFHTYSYGGTAFINSPFSVSSHSSSSTFVISTSNTSSPYAISTETFAGANVLKNFGGSFDGEFPGMLHFTEFAVSGDGSLANDIQTKGSGTFTIDLPLTQGSNASNYGLAGSVDGVATALSNAGYTSE